MKQLKIKYRGQKSDKRLPKGFGTQIIGDMFVFI